MVSLRKAIPSLARYVARLAAVTDRIARYASRRCNTIGCVMEHCHVTDERAQGLDSRSVEVPELHREARLDNPRLVAFVNTQPLQCHCSRSESMTES